MNPYRQLGEQEPAPVDLDYEEAHAMSRCEQERNANTFWTRVFESRIHQACEDLSAPTSFRTAVRDAQLQAVVDEAAYIASLAEKAHNDRSKQAIKRIEEISIEFIRLRDSIQSRRVSIPRT